MWKTHEKIRHLASAALFCLLPALLPAQISPGGCAEVLVQNGKLWLNDSDTGKSITIGNDERANIGANLIAISPNKKRIAYVKDGYDFKYKFTLNPSNNTFDGHVLVFDVAGAYFFEFEVNIKDVIIGMTWVGSKIIKIEEHIGPHASRFVFFLVPESAVSSKDITEIATGSGTNCSVSPTNFALTACIVRGDIQLQDEVVYQPDLNSISKAEDRELQADQALGKNLAWEASGHYLGFVQKIGNGKQTLILLDTSEVTENSDVSTAKIVAREILPFDEKVESISFSSDGHVHIFSKSKDFDQNVGDIRNRPSSYSLKPIATAVKPASDRSSPTSKAVLVGSVCKY